MAGSRVLQLYRRSDRRSSYEQSLTVQEVRSPNIPRNAVRNFYVVLVWKKSALSSLGLSGFCSFFGGPFKFQIGDALSCHVRGGNRRCRRHRWLLIVSRAHSGFCLGPELFVSGCVWPNVKLAVTFGPVRIFTDSSSLLVEERFF